MVATIEERDVRADPHGPAQQTVRRAHPTSTAIASGAWFALVGVAIVWGRHLLDTGVRLGIGAAPLAGRFEWRVTSAVVIPVAFGIVVLVVVPWIADHASWSWVIATAMGLSAPWAVALSRIDGSHAFASPFRKSDYARAAREIHDPHVFLSQFVARIHSYGSHVRGHPPGMEILLWVAARIGLAGVTWNAFLALAGGAAAAAAALVALREVADERLARAALPFLVLAPGAIWWSSADALFTGISAWAVTCVMLATGRDGRRSDLMAVAGGLLFGVTAFLSYGLVLLALIPLSVGASRRRFRPLVLAALAASPVFLVFAVAGFSWLAGLAATRTQYWLGAAHHRPYRYFVLADLAAFALAVGPAGACAVARLRDRRVWLVVGGALVALLVADLSAMSKAEVERIWLPFLPWVLVATSAFAATRRRREVRFWLAVQAASAIVVELAVRSPW